MQKGGLKFLCPAVVMACILCQTVANAQTGASGTAPGYPSKPIRLIVPFAPGGGADVLGRLIGQKLFEAWGRAVAVENRTGAGGTVGAEITSKSPPDGHTLMLSSNSLAVNVTLYPNAGYNALTDLLPVVYLARVPLVLLVHPSVPAKSIKELVALGRKRTGGLNFGSNGSGTTSHLSGVLFGNLAGIQITHIPYRGGSAVVTALMSGEVEMGFVGAIAAQPHMQSNRLRGLAVTTSSPSVAMPNLPTMASIYPGFETDISYSFYVPAATPEPIVARLRDEITKARSAPDIRTAMARDGAEPMTMESAGLVAYFRREVEKYAKLVKLSGAKPE